MASDYASSPLGSLVREIDNLRLGERKKHSPTAWRARIYRAAAMEAEHREHIHIGYDPAGDARFQWLCEWADIHEGARRRHTYGLENTMRFLFMDPGQFLSGKDFASGERLEKQPLTLAQGP
jgi:hypothetical protein